jgi:hypothetical protein
LYRITHIINPVKVAETSDLYKSQPITFATMLFAKNRAKNGQQIHLCTTQFEEDLSICPEDFSILSNLTRSVNNVNHSLSEKKLPLIADILEKLNEAPKADYYIYTNTDIAVMPFFYDAVHQYVLNGHDAVVINRRRISGKYTSVNELPLMYADLGKSHPGFDCFIFKKELLDKFVFGNICVGIPFLEVSFIHNIVSFAKNPLFLFDAHLTFHIGMDVMPKRNKNYYWHNRNEFFKHIYPALKPHFSLGKFPYAALPFYKRALKWVLNPSLFTRNYMELQGKDWREKVTYALNEIRWRILQR